VLGALADWWDGIELWIVQLWFPFQFALVAGVLLPACWLVATLADRACGRILTSAGRARSRRSRS
jgi:hypothetical protein